MLYVEPGYTVPSHTHISSVCRRVYDAEKDRLVTMISHGPFGLTTDIRTSAAIQAYRTVSVHFIDASGSC